MNTPEQTDRDDLYDWGHDREEVAEYYESERLRKEAEPSDAKRIQFVLTRDGCAVAFTKQCITVYRKATLAGKRKYNRGFYYRRVYIESYLFHKQLGERNG